VLKVLVEEGDTVDRGQSLIEIEPYDLIERERQALAELVAREAKFRLVKAGMRQEEIDQAEARLTRLKARHALLLEGPRNEEKKAATKRLCAANAQLEFASIQKERMARLVQSDSTAKLDMDLAMRDYDSALATVEMRKNELRILCDGPRPQELAESEAQVEEARLALEIAKKFYRDDEIKQAEAARDAAQAALDIIRRQKAELTIVAPMCGYIDALDLQPGDLIAPNAPAMTLISRRHLRIRAYVPQRFLRLRVGQQLRVTIDAYPNETFTGEVTFVSHQSEFTPSNVQTSDDRAKQVYRIRVAIRSGAEKLRAGMAGTVWLDSTEAN
jgi:multidrug resistance efflux pump